MSVFWQPVLYTWTCLVYSSLEALGRGCSTEACAAPPWTCLFYRSRAVPGRVCVSVLQYSSLYYPRRCLACSNLCFIWTKPVLLAFICMICMYNCIAAAELPPDLSVLKYISVLQQPVLPLAYICTADCAAWMLLSHITQPVLSSHWTRLVNGSL